MGSSSDSWCRARRPGAMPGQRARRRRSGARRRHRSSGRSRHGRERRRDGGGAVSGGAFGTGGAPDAAGKAHCNPPTSNAPNVDIAAGLALSHHIDSRPTPPPAGTLFTLVVITPPPYDPNVASPTTSTTRTRCAASTSSAGPPQPPGTDRPLRLEQARRRCQATVSRRSARGAARASPGESTPTIRQPPAPSSDRR